MGEPCDLGRGVALSLVRERAFEILEGKLRLSFSLPPRLPNITSIVNILLQEQPCHQHVLH
jgi:hypothetical protein